MFLICFFNKIYEFRQVHIKLLISRNIFIFFESHNKYLTILFFIFLIQIPYLNSLNKSLRNQRMTQLQLKDPFAHGSPSSDKLRQHEKALSELKSQVIAQDKQISSKQTIKLKEFIKQLHDIKNKVEIMRHQCQAKNTKLKQQIDVLEKKLHGFQIGAKTLELESKFKAKISEEEKVFLSNCQKRVQIAESIDYKKLQEIEIDERKSLANEVFKWILVAIYVQPENKFYFPNFKEQVIENEEGSFDLKERLGKFDAYHAKEQQRVKTVKFIESFQKIRASPQFQECGAEIDKIYQIAKLFLECNDIGKRVKQYETEIQKVRKNNLKDDDALVQSRKECDALTEKYRLSQLYLDQLTRVEQSFADKLQKYYKEVELAQSYVAEISNISESKILSLGPRNEIQKRQNCQCSIF